MVRTQPVQGADVWTGAQLAADPSWIFHLDTAHRIEAMAALAKVKALNLPIEAITRDVFALPTLGPLLASLADTIEGGRGVALVRGVPIDDLPVEDVERLFWGMATHVGFPEPQDSSGKTLHHVRAEQAFATLDEARTAFRNSNIRGYQTNVELQFHGDGSDALFFLCRRAGKKGGLSRVVSAGTAFNAVLRRDAELAAILQEDFAFDTRGELGRDHPWQISPIFIEYGGKLSILYKRGYIDLAQRLDGVPPLTARQVDALDALDAALNDPANYHEFLMQPGDIQIANNYNVLHSRTQFEDHLEPEKQRHMLRIWATLRAHRRPIPPPFRKTREFAASQRRRVDLGDNDSTA